MHSFQPIPFQELRSFLTPNPYISFRFHFLHSPQHRTASVVSFLSIPQAPFIQLVTTQALFPRISSGMFYFLRRVSPNKKYPFGYEKEWFLFPKGFKEQISKRQIQQGLFELKRMIDKKNVHKDNSNKISL
ncbi:MAG: hypothetical protein PHR83_10155 [Paludibacter sp.]|nr:hypothetical protein [Paludibacter sp.]